MFSTTSQFYFTKSLLNSTMKKLSIITILALLGIIFSIQKVQAQVTITLQNTTYASITEIYVAEDGSGNWSENVVYYSLETGDTVSFDVPYEGYWDIAVGDGSGDYCYFYGIRMEGYDMEIPITDDDISSCLDIY